MNPDLRKRHVVSYENMSEELAALFNEKYPKGFNDYLPDLVQYKKPDGKVETIWTDAMATTLNGVPSSGSVSKTGE